MTPPIRMVPVEPTDEMMQAGYKAYGASLYACVDGRQKGWGENAIAIYHAMLTAAPVREEGGAVSNTELRDAITLILPMAKGYAATNPVGSNQAYVDYVENLIATREEAPAEAGEPEALRMAYKTGYQEGVEDSDGNFCRDACEEGWGQYLEALRAQPQAREEAQPVAWRCFHCDETFTDRRCAAAHFGGDEDAEPACKIKMGGERTMLDALRRAEKAAGDATFAMLNESTEAAQAYYAQQGRHAEQLTAAEQTGYERGLRDAQAHPETLGLTAATPPAVALASIREQIRTADDPEHHTLGLIDKIALAALQQEGK